MHCVWEIGLRMLKEEYDGEYSENMLILLMHRTIHSHVIYNCIFILPNKTMNLL